MMALGVPRSQPVLLIHIPTELRASSYKIWSVLKVDAGIEVRAERGKRQIRLIIPRPGTESVNDIPTDRFCPTHVIESIEGLRLWLSTLSSASTN